MNLKMSEPYLRLLAEEWLDTMKTERKYSTYLKYRNICVQYIFDIPETADYTVRDIPMHYKQLTVRFELSESIRSSLFCVLHQIAKYAEEQYGTSPIILRGVKHKPVNRVKEKSITAYEQKKLLIYLWKEMADPKHISEFGIFLCLATGMRLGELCALKWEDVDLEEGLIFINRTVQRLPCEDGSSKTKLYEGDPKSFFSRRVIPLSGELISYMRRMTKQGDYLISGNKPTDPRTYEKRFKRYLKNAGIGDHTFHSLRHTFATNCIDHGVDTKSLSEILGHSDVSVTLNLYVHPSTEVKRKHMDRLTQVYTSYIGVQDN